MKRAKQIWDVVTTVLVSVVFILAVLLFGARLIGFQLFTVMTGSMEPDYPVGALLYVKEVDYTTIKKNDVITFMFDEETVATHRVVEVIRDEEDPSVISFLTKGDANDADDGNPIHCKNVIGVPKLSIPYLGHLAAFIKNPPGSYITVAVGAILLILLLLPDLIFSDEGARPRKSRKTSGNRKPNGTDRPKTRNIPFKQ